MRRIEHESYAQYSLLDRLAFSHLLESQSTPAAHDTAPDDTADVGRTGTATRASLRARLRTGAETAGRGVQVVELLQREGGSDASWAVTS